MRSFLRLFIFVNLILSFYFFNPSFSFAKRTNLSDDELDDVYAQGFLMRMTFDVASDEAGLINSLFPQLDLSSVAGNGLGALSNPNLSSLSNRKLSSTLSNFLLVNDNAFGNSRNLFNVAALGDVGVGVNLFVFIGDLNNGTINHQSSNVNFSNLFSGLQR